MSPFRSKEFVFVYGFLLLSFILILPVPSVCFSQEPFQGTNLKETIEMAIEMSLKLQQSRYVIDAAQENRKAQRTEFFPSFFTRYDYIHRSEAGTNYKFNQGSESENDFIINPEDEFRFETSFSQPIFSGFELTNKYEISKITVDLAELSKMIIRQNVILDAVNAYFSVLKYRKLATVAHDVLDQLRSLKEIAENMHQAGFISTTDLLTSKVKLASAKQDLIKSQIKVKIAQSGYNILLQRPLNSPVSIVEVSEFTPFASELKCCLDYAVKNRIEIQMAEKNIQRSEKEFELSKKNIYPDIDLIGKYTRRGTDLTVDGGQGIADKDFMEIRVAASWDLWDWGRTKYKSNEKLNYVSQAKSLKKQLGDDIRLEVQEAYLAVTETEGNIYALELSIDQARENFRITKEKYKQKAVTITEYLAAQTLNTETLAAHYNAMYDFKIAKATLYRAIGKYDPEDYVQLSKIQKGLNQ